MSSCKNTLQSEPAKYTPSGQLAPSRAPRDGCGKCKHRPTLNISPEYVSSTLEGGEGRGAPLPVPRGSVFTWEVIVGDLLGCGHLFDTVSHLGQVQGLQV